MRMKWFYAMLAIPLVLSACSSGAKDSGTKTTLTVVAFAGGGNEIANIPDINADFGKAYPNIKLEYKYVANPDYDNYNNTRLAAGTAADVLMTNPLRTNVWGKQGYLEDLSGEPWKDRMIENILPYAQVDGKTLSFVQQNVPIGLYVNQDALAKAGIDSVPKDWPEFIAALETLKAKGQKGLLAPNQGGWYSEQFALAVGASLVSPDWAQAYDAGDSKWDPDWVPVYERMQELLAKDLVDGETMNAIDPFKDGVAEFIGGDWAFVVHGAWDLKHISESADFQVSFNAMPGGEAGSEPKSFTFVGSGWAVNADSDNTKAAKAYINFMSQPENTSRYLAGVNAFSTLKDVPNPPMPNAEAAAKAFTGGRTVPSQVELIKFPGGELAMQKIGSKLFADPNLSVSNLMASLDKSIPKTP